MRAFLGSQLLFVLVMALAVSVLGSAVTAQEPEADETGIQPIAGNWSLLVNTGPAASPGALLAPIDDLATVAFTFDPATDRFRTYRAGSAVLSDLAEIRSGEAFWVFVPPERLDGDLAFLEIAATVPPTAVTLQPGFTLAAWIGAQGVPVSEAISGLPIRRAYLWVAATQSFQIWDPGLPSSLREDFELEYGAGLWVDLAGSEPVVWEQE